MSEIPKVIQVDNGGASTGSDGSKLEINIDIGANPHLNKDEINRVVKESVAKSLEAVEKQNRKNNLRTNGVSYR